MTTIKIPAVSARSLALVAIASYKKTARGLPPPVDDDKLSECMTVVQHGFYPTKVMATEGDQKKCRAILSEENMRRGLSKCTERAERLADFFAYASFAQDSNNEAPVDVTLSFDDYVLLSKADEVKAEDFS